MVLTSSQVAVLLCLVALACAFASALQCHSRMRKAQIRAQQAESKAMLLEIENQQLLSLHKMRSKYDSPRKEQPVGATFELDKRTNQWRVT